MEKFKGQLDCYDLFDRMGEGVMFRFVVTYDWEDILKNDINGDNFSVEMIGFDKSVDRYFSAYRISRDGWIKDAQDYLMRKECEVIKENFFEHLSDEKNDEYNERFLQE